MTRRPPYPRSGFTLIELLIATAITLILAAAIAAATPAARAAFDRVPAELEMQQRGRIAIDVLSEALRASHHLRPSMPNESGGFAEMTVLIPVVSAAQGVLLSDQESSAAPMTLDVIACPNVNEVCGFTSGMIAIISDADGIDDFIVGATNQAAWTLTPSAPLSRAYAAGAAVRQMEQASFKLDARSALVRVTGAPAVQPVVDAVADLSFAIDGDRIDVSLTVRAASERLRDVIADRVFKTSITRRNAP